MSSSTDVATVYDVGTYRDVQNAERFYAAFESWLGDHGSMTREPGGVERVLATFARDESRRPSNEDGPVAFRGTDVEGQVTLTRFITVSREFAAAGPTRPRRRSKDADARPDHALAT
jgi:hypothetical protein